jgi:hypothetical protein
MSDTKLKTRIKRLFKAYLEPQGFVLARARIPERKLQGLRQGIEFQPGTGHLDKKFTLNVYWSFTHSLDAGVAMHANKRIGDLAGVGDKWFSRSDSELDADFLIAEKLLIEVGLPYLARYDTIAKIVDACESGLLSSTDAFGIDEAWRHFNFGYCQSFLGNNAQSIEHYREVVSKHSERPYAWVQERKRVANEQLRNLAV